MSVTGYLSGVILRRLLLVLALAATAAVLLRSALLTPPAAALEVWHGSEQRIGHLGDAQPDFNLMGTASGSRLTLEINGDEPRELVIASGEFGFRRLGAAGHFNADVPISSLREGSNTLVLRAEGAGPAVSETVILERAAGAGPSLPHEARWSEVENPQDAGQMVDGLWQLEPEGLRSPQPLYDRLFLIGHRGWTDYEVRTSVTVHSVAERTGPKSGPPGLGVIMRFAGHVVDPPRFPDAQPKWGFQPLGAILWLRWVGGHGTDPVRQFYRGDRNESQDAAALEGFESGTTYALRARCDTDADDPSRTRYRMRIWPEGTEEPTAWDLDVVQESETALRAGGVALVAHHVDVTYGDVVVTESSAD